MAVGPGDLTCFLVSAGGGGPTLLPLQVSLLSWLPAPLTHLSHPPPPPPYREKVREFGPTGGRGRVKAWQLAVLLRVLLVVEEHGT